MPVSREGAFRLLVLITSTPVSLEGAFRLEARRAGVPGGRLLIRRESVSLEGDLLSETLE